MSQPMSPAAPVRASQSRRVVPRPERTRRARPAPTRAPGAASADDFARVALPHRPELLAHALRLTRHRADAEDLVQDTMIRAMKAWARFERGSNCRAWLFRIMTNGFISNYRRRRRHNRFAHESGDDSVHALYPEARHRAADPAASIDEGLSDETLGALARLGDEYRAVIELADLGGAKYRDIADQLGLPLGTVMSRLFRARRRLEAELGGFAARDYGIRRRGDGATP